MHKKQYSCSLLLKIKLNISLLFILWHLLLGQKFINELFIWDDLHLIGKYSIDECLGLVVGILMLLKKLLLDP